MAEKRRLLKSMELAEEEERECEAASAAADFYEAQVAAFGEDVARWEKSLSMVEERVEKLDRVCLEVEAVAKEAEEAGAKAEQWIDALRDKQVRKESTEVG